jgi:glycosyltransferase involved in cell wall biosynthesis
MTLPGATPRASVVIPSYNHAQFIEAAVRSVLDSFDDLELIVIDDGSSDDSVEKLRRFESDPRFQLHVQENRGAHAALNRGMALASGEILFILNSDDLFHEQRLPTLVSCFERDPTLAMAGSWLEVIDGDGVQLGIKEGFDSLEPWPRPSDGPCLSDTRDPTLALLETNFLSTTSNMAFRRRLLVAGELQFADLRYTHDWDFALRASGLGRFELVEEPLVQYRVHGSNTIAEGQQRLTRSAMHFEILWVVARYLHRVIVQAGERGFAREDLLLRANNGLPRFGCPSLMRQLSMLRGREQESPLEYDRLLLPDNVFRKAAMALLLAAGDRA